MDDRDPALTEARAARALGCGRRRGVLVLATLLASACATVEAPVEVEVDDEPPYAVWPSGTLADELCVTCTRGHMWKVDTDTTTSAEGHAAHEAGGTAATIEDVPMPSWTLVVSEMPSHRESLMWTPRAAQIREAEAPIARHVAAYHAVFVPVLDELTCRVSGRMMEARQVIQFECFKLEEELRMWAQSSGEFNMAKSSVGFRHEPNRIEWWEKVGDTRERVRRQQERKYRFDILFDPERSCVISDNLSPSVHSATGHSRWGGAHLLGTPVAPPVTPGGGQGSHEDGSEGQGRAAQDSHGEGAEEQRR